MCSERILDEEVICRRIPPSKPWFEPPNRVSTANYKLDRRQYELGLSVYRLAIVSESAVLEMPDAIPGSRIAITTVGEIRRLVNGKGEPLHLDVIASADEGDPGHAEIRGPVHGDLSPAASKALRNAFELVDDGDGAAVV